MQARKIAIFFLSLFIWGFSTAVEPQKVSGIYSNLKFNKESGDLSGMELLIIPNGKGANLEYVVLVQISEGGAPFSALVPLKMVGPKFEFTLPTGRNYDRQHFTGVFKGTGIVIRWSQGDEEHLKRGKSYWQ